jgi:hypothetical protein
VSRECKSCTFWRWFEAQPNDKGQDEAPCEYLPPPIVQQQINRAHGVENDQSSYVGLLYDFPLTGEYYWCSEFKHRNG